MLVVLMDAEQLLALYDEDERREVTYPTMRREVMPHVVRHVDLVGDQGVVIYSRLDASQVDRVVDEQIAYFRDVGHHFEWKVYAHDTPGDLRERLVARGFQADEPEALMILDLEEGVGIPPLLAEIDIRRVADPSHLGDVRAIKDLVYGEDLSSLTAQLEAEMRTAPELLSVYVAYIEDVPASCAWIRFGTRSRFAGLWGGSTVAAYRGRGLYTALLAVRMREARDRGVRFLMVDAGPMSRPNLEKHGFRVVSHATACTWHRHHSG